MGWECSMPVTDEECRQCFGGKAKMKETTTETWGQDNIKMNLREIGWSGTDWTDLA
jgi:hypothetical protein